MRARRRAPRAFTLMELLVSTALTSFLVVVIGSAIVLASRAIPSAASPAMATIDTIDVAQQLSRELSFAESFDTLAPRAIEFTVADRDGDAVGETIRYEWSGVDHDGLIRIYNDGADDVVLADVRDFALAYELETGPETVDGPAVTGDEAMLASSDASGTGFAVTSSAWIGQLVQPALAADASSWTVTRVFVFAKQAGTPDGVLSVQLRHAQPDGRPPPAVVAQETLLESDLQTWYTWTEITFDAAGVSAEEDLCLVVEGVSGSGTLARVVIVNAGSGRLGTADAGASWSVSGSASMRFSAYGTSTTPGPSTTADVTRLRSVGLSIRAGDSPASRIDTRAAVVNAIEVTP